VISAKKYNIIDDTYNASPLAAEEAINTLTDLDDTSTNVVILGEMKDLGSLSKISHQKLGIQIASTKIKYLVTIGKVAKIIGQLAAQNHFAGKTINVRDIQEALKYIQQLPLEKPLILIKGSRHEHLERIVLGLQNKSTEISCYHCGKLK